MAQIKAAIFDVFGVLISNAADLAFEKLGGDREAHAEEIRELYMQYDLGYIDFETEHKQIADMLGVSYEAWLKAMTEQTQYNDQLVTYIAKLPLKTAYLSNIGAESVALMHQHLDLSAFDEQVRSSEIGFIKPSPEAYTTTAERLEVEPSECVFIDDSPSNISGAEAVGMTAILFTSNKQVMREIDVLLTGA